MPREKLLQAANLPKPPEPAAIRPPVPGPVTGQGNMSDKAFVNRFAQDADYADLKAKIRARAGANLLARSYWRCPRCGKMFEMPASEHGKPGIYCFSCNAGGMPGGAHLVELTSPAEIAGYHSAVKRDNERWKAGAAARKAKLDAFNRRTVENLPR